MLWFFERDRDALRLETRYNNATREYVVIVRYPDDLERIERFKDIETFRTWLMLFEEDLAAHRWTPLSGGPILLSDGWPDREA